MDYSCLIIDDEESIAQNTSEYFNIFNINTAYVTSYDACLDFFKNNTTLIMLLDINLGNQSGFKLCKELRRTLDIPILFISARTSEDDILTALNIGGDDYITKPYTLNILLAKVKAMLKRIQLNQSLATVSDNDATTQLNTINLNYNYRQVNIDGTDIKLKEMEFKLLDYMMKKPNTVITKEEFFEQVWHDKFLGDGTLTVHIRHLREKIEENPNDPKYIKTIWGVGYLFEVK